VALGCWKSRHRSSMWRVATLFVSLKPSILLSVRHKRLAFRHQVYEARKGMVRSCGVDEEFAIWRT